METIKVLWLTLYPLIMLHVVFAQSWRRTIFKTILLAIGYGLTVTLAYVVETLIVFILV